MVAGSGNSSATQNHFKGITYYFISDLQRFKSSKTGPMKAKA